MTEAYDNHAIGLRILPGQWRPHYPFEHIAWISPPWPSQDYVWFDFPEAINCNRGLIFLSHINPDAHSVYTDLPPVEWRLELEGIAFERTLPNGIRFGGSLARVNEREVGLELYIHNDTSEPLTRISLQTCVFLRACREFADYTQDNKFIHVPQRGWIPFPEAQRLDNGTGYYGAGWRGGPKVADWPIMAVVSNQAQRLMAVTWYEHTISMIANPNHPCCHADPRFKDLEAGESATIFGSLFFFEGPLAELAAALRPWEKPKAFL